jgi:hypothetical protein
LLSEFFAEAFYRIFHIPECQTPVESGGLLNFFGFGLFQDGHLPKLGIRTTFSPLNLEGLMLIV